MDTLSGLQPSFMYNLIQFCGANGFTFPRMKKQEDLLKVVQEEENAFLKTLHGIQKFDRY